MVRSVMKGSWSSLSSAVGAVRFHRPHGFSWFGRSSSALAAQRGQPCPPAVQRAYLLNTLQLRLYESFYCMGRVVPLLDGRAAGLVLSDASPLVTALAAANCGRGRWEEGWELRGMEGDELVIARNGLELRAGRDECAGESGEAPAAGARLRVRFPRESMAGSPGFYVAFGERVLPRSGAGEIVRLYWNLTPQGAVRFMRRATRELNEIGLPFQLKALADPARFGRCDAVVLYVRRDDYARTAASLASMLPRLRSFLRPLTPVFTKRLRAGVALAEDPEDGSSFGLHRCRLVAEGLVRAHELGRRSVWEHVQTVAQRFSEEGIALERPFLNPGSADAYDVGDWLPGRRRGSNGGLGSGLGSRRGARRQPPLRARRIEAGAVGPSRGTLLDAAAAIGRGLAGEALWHCGRCNWVGMADETSLHPHGLRMPPFRALGPELYAGTSGIALFLAELHVLTGAAGARRTAVGAIRQALSRAVDVPPDHRAGLYGGWIGIALAAARVGRLLGEDELLAKSLSLLRRFQREGIIGAAFDLVSGRAGAIAGLVALDRIFPARSLLEFAERAADDLLRLATEDGRVCSWKSPDLPAGRDLTGLSHGAAGAASALLELWSADGGLDYRKAAERAFAYERRWFDQRRGNWADFRAPLTGGRRPRRPAAFSTYWCHGAPGVALSRLRAYELTGDETLKLEAVQGLETTRRAIHAALRSGAASLSLCHGLAGNADVLDEGRRVLGADTDPRALALRAARHVMRAVARESRSVALTGATVLPPGLMSGLAGIGYFYLRLAQPDTPSILLPRREQLAASLNAA